MNAPLPGPRAVRCHACGRPGPEGPSLFAAQRAAVRAGWRARMVPEGAIRRPVYQCPACPPFACACGAVYTLEAWSALPDADGTEVEGRRLAWRRCTAPRPGGVCGSTVTREVLDGE